MSKILVTGGCGMIGSNLVKRLVKEGHEVFVMDNLWRGILEYLNERDIVITDLSVDNLVWTAYECIVDDIIAQYEEQQEEVE